MTRGAPTPEELDVLLEDAFVVRDPVALAPLFAQGAVLASCDGRGEARGNEAIARFAARLWEEGRTYVADPRRVLQARDTALLVTGAGIRVARRDADGGWRYAIALLALDDSAAKEER